MALHHAVSGELIDVAPLGAQLAEAKSAALYKSEHLEVMRVILPAGKSVPPHQIQGEVTIQCLEGRVEIDIPDSMLPMFAGSLVCLAGGVPHALTAMEDSSLLVTMQLQ